MTERVLIPLPGVGTLALDEEAYRAALALGERLSPGGRRDADADPNEPCLEAEELAKLLKVPVSWVEQAARENRIPSLQFGRWRRFKRTEVEAAIRHGRSSK